MSRLTWENKRDVWVSVRRMKNRKATVHYDECLKCFEGLLLMDEWEEV